MSELCLRGALRLDSTKGLEKERIVLAQSLGFMTYLLPLHILLTLVSWKPLGCRLWLALEVPKVSRPMSLQLEIN